MFSANSKIRPLPNGTIIVKAAYAFIVLYLSAVLAFSLFYLLSGYEALKTWYLTMNNCFSKNDVWARDYFTGGVKEEGNHLAIAGILISITGIFYFIRKWKKHKKQGEDVPIEVQPDKKTWLWYVAIFLLTISMGLYEWRLLSPTYDEILSAIFAKMPSFQIISYYLTTNNHVFFNLLNHVLFGWYDDKLVSGRILSLLAYAGTMMCIFYWLMRLLNHRLLSFLLLVPVALQFSTLGFGALARGYELQLLCGWVALLSMFNYAKTADADALRVNICCNILGFIILPSYLYFHLAQVIFIAAIMTYNRRFTFTYWKYQVILISLVFLFYLPAFCFSGIDTFINNRATKPHTADLASFLPTFSLISKYFIRYCFLGINGEGNKISYALFVLPLLLFFSKQKRDKLIAFFYLSIWLAYTGWSLTMRYLPFERNLNMQYSFTMVCVVYTFYVVVNRIAAWIKNNTVNIAFQLVSLGIPLFFLSAYLYNYNKNQVAYQIYGYNINGTYSRCIDQMHLIPKGSSIAFSEHSFFLFYLYERQKYNVTQCTGGHEDYYVMRSEDGETLPEEKARDYFLFTTGITEYEVYKRK